MTPPPVDVRKIDFAYRDVAVLHDISFAIRPGEFVALAGPNGAGKSTLLSLLTSHASPKRGTITVFGRELREWEPVDLARHIAAVPQREIIPAAMTGLEVALLGRTPYLRGLFRFESDEDRRIAREALERCDAAQFADRPVGELSGGERRLCVLARALAQQPQVILLDEPAAALDLHHQQQIFRLLRKLQKEEGVTVIVVVHDLNLAGLYADRILLLREGRLVGDGTPADILTVERLSALYGADVWVTPSPDGTPTIGLRR